MTTIKRKPEEPVIAEPNSTECGPGCFLWSRLHINAMSSECLVSIVKLPQGDYGKLTWTPEIGPV
jgi:hypothetical protein